MPTKSKPTKSPKVPKSKGDPFWQLCVLQSMHLGDASPQEFERGMKKIFKCRFKFEAEVKTLPDLDRNKKPIPGTGGRTDLFFYVHEDDTDKFAVPRMEWGIRWWEDVIVYNKGNRHLYTRGFIKNHPPKW